MYNITMQKDLAYYVALSKNPKIGARTMRKILAVFTDLEKLWKMSPSKILEMGVPSSVVKSIEETKAKIDPEEEMKKLKKYNIEAITIKDKRYPSLLKEIPDAPSLIYLKGELVPEDNFAVAVVGSRKYTAYGKRVTEHIAQKLAENGVSVVSGLALGIDGIAHKAALQAHNGRTIAVLPNGLDRIYPTAHADLARRILDQGGAIISEFPVGTLALKFNFPIRNRIIAGLSLGVVVIEGALASGTLLTAHSAIEYNREVFAVPGDIFSDNSAGPNHLIKYGAKLVSSVDDILQELNIETKVKHQEAKEVIPDSREEAIILAELCSDKPVHVDNLAKTTKLEIALLNSKLILMEMKGKVRNLGASQYVLGR